jgi:hypothetical protein
MGVYFLSIFALSAVVYFSSKEGVPKELILFVVGSVIEITHLTLLFGRVAIKEARGLILQGNIVI